MGIDIINSLADAAEYLKNEEIDKAMVLYEGIIHADSKNIDALLGCGKIWQKKGDFKNALNYYYKVLEIDSDNAIARTSIDMLNGILNFYNKDMYNP
jgi:Tfp pilus assembly protein PilF